MREVVRFPMRRPPGREAASILSPFIRTDALTLEFCQGAVCVLPWCLANRSGKVKLTFITSDRRRVLPGLRHCGKARMHCSWLRPAWFHLLHRYRPSRYMEGKLLPCQLQSGCRLRWKMLYRYRSSRNRRRSVKRIFSTCLSLSLWVRRYV